VNSVTLSSYLQKVIVLLHEEIQEPEKRCSGEANDIVIVAFNFSYKKPTQTLFALIQQRDALVVCVCVVTYLYGKATSAVKPLT
jgi:hypothetical protein